MQRESWLKLVGLLAAIPAIVVSLVLRFGLWVPGDLSGFALFWITTGWAVVIGLVCAILLLRRGDRAGWLVLAANTVAAVLGYHVMGIFGG